MRQGGARNWSIAVAANGAKDRGASFYVSTASYVTEVSSLVEHVKDQHSTRAGRGWMTWSKILCNFIDTCSITNYHGNNEAAKADPRNQAPSLWIAPVPAAEPLCDGKTDANRNPAYAAGAAAAPCVPDNLRWRT